MTLPGQAWGGAAQQFAGLAYDPEFRVVHWLLFTADGEAPGTAYVDNIRLGPHAE